MNEIDTEFLDHLDLMMNYSLIEEASSLKILDENAEDPPEEPPIPFDLIEEEIEPQEGAKK